MFLAIDRVSKFTYVKFHDSAGKKEGAAFLRNVVAAFPYKIHTVLNDNGMAFADLPKNREGPSRRFLGPHIFDRVCIEHGIEHRLTKPYHPWTNGQAERMNRTTKDATVKVFHYEDLESLKAHVLAFVTAYNFAKHLKAMANALSGHLQCLDERLPRLQNQPAPSHSGTTQHPRSGCHDRLRLIWDARLSRPIGKIRTYRHGGEPVFCGSYQGRKRRSHAGI
jgi:hypothetical protein